MKAKVLLAAIAFLVGSGAAVADPIVYQGSITDSSATSEVPGFGYFLEDVTEVDFWSFFGLAGRTVTIRMNRLNQNLDTAFSLYQGTTAVDTSSVPVLSGWTMSDFGGLSFLTFADDEIPRPPSPNGDALLANFVLPATGFYTIAAGGAASTDAGPYPYEISVQVPVSPTWLLLAIGGLALAFSMRSRAAIPAEGTRIAAWKT
jgi:hypothetical protein